MQYCDATAVAADDDDDDDDEQKETSKEWIMRLGIYVNRNVYIKYWERT